MKGKLLASAGAVAAAVLASSCCILPALLALLGAGSLGVGAKLAAFRPYFMGVTFTFLAAAFYFTYRKKPPAVQHQHAMNCATTNADDCCAVPSRANRTSKMTLWLVTAIALGAMFYPQIQAWRHSGGRQAPAAVLVRNTSNTRRITFRIEGMSCEACAVGIEKTLMKVEGVTKAAVSFKGGKAVVEWNGKRPDKSALAKAVEAVEGKAVFDTNTKEARVNAK